MRHNEKEPNLNAFLSENEQQLQLLRKINEILLKEQIFQPIIPKLKDLELRLQQPLRLLIIGEFNAGKSSLVNALLQEDIVATNNKATTAVNTMIEYGETPEVLLFFEDGSTKSFPFEQLEAVTAEIEGEGSLLRKKLLYVRLFYPVPFLKDIVLVDSPGLNSHHLTHTEQTMSMIPKVDDAIWVFLGGGAGRGTEQEFLKDMVKQGIKPFGVINRIDEVDDYIFNPEQAIANDKAVLGDNVRGLLPISAYEARIGFRDGDDETLQLSGFLPFLEEMRKVKQNKPIQLERQRQYVLSFWLELLTIIQDIIQSPAYEKSRKNLAEFTVNEVRKVEEFKKDWESKKYSSVNFYLELHNLRGDTSLKEWLNASIIKKNQNLLPNYQRWRKVLISLNNLEHEIERYKSRYENFLNRYENQLGSFFTKYRHLFANKQTVRDLENERDQLYNDYVSLQTKINNVNADIHQLQYELDPESVQELYGTLEKNNVADIELCKSKLEEFKAKNEGMEKQLKGLVSQYLFLIPLRKAIDDFQKSYRLSIPANFNLQYFGRELENSIEIHKSNYQNAVASASVDDIERILPNTNLIFPEMVSGLPRFKKKWPVFLRPFTIGFTVIAATTGFIIGAKSIDWPTPISDYNYELSNLSEAEEEYREYLSYEYQGDGIGIVKVNNGDIVLYDAPNFYSESEVFLRDGTTWEVYEIDGDWYKIQDNYWVLNDDVEFEENIKAYVSDYYEEGIATLEFNGDRLNMYTGASTSDKMLAYIEPGSYTITHISEKKWFKIDDYGWVEFGPNTEVFQHYLNEQLKTFDDPIRTEYGKADNIPVFTGPSREDPVIGFIQGNGNVKLYEIPNSKWGRIGQNIWVELDKYFDIDWVYRQATPYYEEPIGQVYINTPVLNVRDFDEKEGNLVGTIQAGTTLEVYEQSVRTGWYRVGVDEWVSNLSDLVTFTPFENKVEVNSDLPDQVVTYLVETPIYAQPYMQENNYYSTVRPQTYFDVLRLYEGDDGDWYEVRDELGDIYFIRKVDVD